MPAARKTNSEERKVSAKSAFLPCGVRKLDPPANRTIPPARMRSRAPDAMHRLAVDHENRLVTLSTPQDGSPKYNEMIGAAKLISASAYRPSAKDTNGAAKPTSEPAPSTNPLHENTDPTGLGTRREPARPPSSYTCGAEQCSDHQEYPAHKIMHRLGEASA